MVNLSKYFDKIYVINLDRRPDRYESFKTEMCKFGIKNIEKFSAIDGNLITQNNVKLLAGEIGILQSHLTIIKKCKEEGLNNVLIMEDDVFFSDEIDDTSDPHRIELEYNSIVYVDKEISTETMENLKKAFNKDTITVKENGILV
jgi:GR25 family glycosyltransferase involved in LPS biosynthesis